MSKEDGRSHREKSLMKVVVNCKEAELNSVNGNVDLDCVNNRSSAKNVAGYVRNLFGSIDKESVKLIPKETVKNKSVTENVSVINRVLW